MEPQSFWSLLSHAVVILGGQLKGREDVWLRSGETIRIHTSRTLDIWADGEFISRTPAHFELQPNSLRVYVPSDYFTQGKLAMLRTEKQVALDNIINSSRGSIDHYRWVADSSNDEQAGILLYKQALEREMIVDKLAPQMYRLGGHAIHP